MPEWEVIIPIVGYALVNVSGADEKEAFENALDGVTVDDIEQWEGVEHIVQGNVFYGEVNNIEATRIDEDDEEEER
ncbi:MAG: hypothetical protein WC329_08395 [Candidatus Omnitrophota bacterium]|jgi:hypothetical protein|nr:hypothetical protein [Dehalococcoidia bacterium]